MKCVYRLWFLVVFLGKVQWFLSQNQACLSAWGPEDHGHPIQTFSFVACAQWLLEIPRNIWWDYALCIHNFTLKNMQTDELLIFASEKVPLQDALFIPTHVTDLLLAKQNFPLAFFFFFFLPPLTFPAFCWNGTFSLFKHLIHFFKFYTAFFQLFLDLGL